MYMTWSFYRLWEGSHLIVSAENMHRWWALNITSTLWIFIKGCVISAGNVCATLRTNQHITWCLTRTFRWPASAAIFGADSSALLHVLESSWRKHFQNGRSQNMQWASYLGKKVTCVASWYSIVRLKKTHKRTFAGGSRWMERLRCLGQPWWRALMDQGEAEKTRWVSNSHGSSIKGH